MKNKIILATILTLFTVMLIAINYESVKIPRQPTWLVSIHDPNNGQVLQESTIEKGQSYKQVLLNSMKHHYVWSDKVEGNKRTLEYRNVYAYLGPFPADIRAVKENCNLIFTFENDLLIKVEKKVN